MTIQQLEYILAVEKAGSFTKAADECLVTQPTLSAMIQKLEDELLRKTGSSHFCRDSRRRSVSRKMEKGSKNFETEHRPCR